MGGNVDSEGGWGEGKRLSSTAKLYFNPLPNVRCTATIPMNFTTSYMCAHACVDFIILQLRTIERKIAFIIIIIKRRSFYYRYNTIDK